MASKASRFSVAFLPLYGFNSPSSRHRAQQFLEPLRRAGIECHLLPAPERNARRRLGYLPRLFRLARRCDVLYLQKRLLPAWVLRPLVRLNPRLIYDFDDAIYLQPGRRKALEATLAASQAVIAGNETLAAYARRFNRQVSVLPTVVDAERYRPAPRSRSPEAEVVLGWIGSDGRALELAALQPVFDALAGRYGDRVSLHIVAGRPPAFEVPMRSRFLPWSLQASLPALQQFDIGISPLLDHEWNQGKCGLKLIQYMAAGLPAVVSPVGANREILVDGETGFLAESAPEWLDALQRLIEEDGLRARMGRCGRRRAEQVYSLQAVLPRLAAVLESVAGGGS